MRYINTRPVGPVRMTTKTGREVGIFPSYDSAIGMWQPGDTIVAMPQEEFDREMAEYRAGQQK